MAAAVDFFALEEDARRQSRKLVVLFALAVLAVVAAVDFVVLLVFHWAESPRSSGFWHPVTAAITSAVTLAIVLGGSIRETRRLRAQGGAAVAEMVGAVPVPRATDDLRLKRLWNVVEEMAIASGLPVPRVYRLPEAGINAFAAGYTPEDAVIAVTDGAIDLLKRDELQGVIAHEFAHILNGDMRLKMHLMGLLAGLTGVSDLGIWILSGRIRVRARDREAQALGLSLFLGFALFLIGTVGLVAADLIKRAISRQREFLADAYAVEFTRNPLGLANALKVIGGYARGSRIHHPAAHRASHFFFSHALGGSGRLWATHPPLEARIRRLDPQFTGKLPRIAPEVRANEVHTEAVMMLAGAASPQFQLEEARLRTARLLPILRARVLHPEGAQAVMLALLLGRDRNARRQGLRTVHELAPKLFRETLEIADAAARVPPEARLALVELAVPALRAVPREDIAPFLRAVQALIRADGRVEPFEFLLQRILLRYLAPRLGTRRPHPGKPTDADLLTVWAMLARFGRHADPDRALRDAAQAFGIRATPPEAVDWRALHAALDRLEYAPPNTKRRLIEGAARLVRVDGQVNTEELELVRAVAEAIGVPMPLKLTAKLPRSEPSSAAD
ncbi:MAG: peptidase M48 [Zetaproteobacteria bacterium]|nr:MAG: peptidase M48 [Zetaproteobacteria bacterium]